MARHRIKSDGSLLSSTERFDRWQKKHHGDRCTRRFVLPIAVSELLAQDAAQLDVSDSIYVAAAVLLASEHHDAMPSLINTLRDLHGYQVHPRSPRRGLGTRRPLPRTA